MQAEKNLITMIKLMENVLPMEIRLDYKSTGAFDLTFQVQVVKGGRQRGFIKGQYTYQKSGFKFRASFNGEKVFSSDNVTPQMVFGAYAQALSEQGFTVMNQTPRRKGFLYVFNAMVSLYVKVKGSNGFELVSRLSEECLAVDKYTGLTHKYQYRDTSNNETFLTQVRIQNGRGEQFTTTNAEQLIEYIGTGKLTTSTQPVITPQDDSLHVVVVIVKSTIYSKWYTLQNGEFVDVSLQVYDSVRNFNNNVQHDHQKIPYMYGNGYVCYAFGCGLTHYLQQDNMNRVIPSIKATRLRVWNNEELNVPKDVHDFGAYLKQRLSN